MNNKKIILVVVIVLLLCVSCVLVFTLNRNDVSSEIDNTEDESEQLTEHIHQFGEWQNATGNSELPCDKRSYFCICSCGYKETKQGGVEDHNFVGTFMFDDDFHWQICEICGIENFEKHELDADGYCDVCKNHILPTEGIVYEISDDGTYASVISYEGAAKRVMIASSYNGLPVKAIKCDPYSYKNSGVKAFINCSTITSMIIPDSITDIGPCAFEGCVNLADIYLPDGLINIGFSAFYNTAFYNNADNWDNDILYIGQYLIKVRKEYSGEKDMEYVDGVCIIRDGTLLIANSAFMECRNIRWLSIPNSVTIIGANAFDSCSNLEGSFVPVPTNDYGGYTSGSLIIPDSVKRIGGYAFSDCEKMTFVTISNSLVVIEQGVFSSCSSLISIEIPNNVTKISESAFKNCTILGNVKIGNGVKSIGKDAFYGCSEIVHVYYVGTPETWRAIEMGVNNDILKQRLVGYIDP